MQRRVECRTAESVTCTHSSRSAPLGRQRVHARGRDRLAHARKAAVHQFGAPGASARRALAPRLWAAAVVGRACAPAVHAASCLGSRAVGTLGDPTAGTAARRCAAGAGRARWGGVLHAAGPVRAAATHSRHRVHPVKGDGKSSRRARGARALGGASANAAAAARRTGARRVGGRRAGVVGVRSSESCARGCGPPASDAHAGCRGCAPSTLGWWCAPRAPWCCSWSSP